MFAVIKTGGKQYRVAPADLIEVDKIEGEAGSAVAFSDVLMVGGEDTVLGTPTVAGARVAGEVVEQGRKPKLIAFKKRRRKNSQRKRGHRQEFTLVRITRISTAGETEQQPEAAEPPVEAAAATSATRSATGAEPSADSPQSETDIDSTTIESKATDKPAIPDPTHKDDAS